MKKHSFGKFLVGLGIGVGAGMLLSPKSGKENREALKNKAQDTVDKIKNVDLNKTKEDLTKQFEKLKKELKDMDAEKAKKLAKKKGKELTDKANELIADAKAKADPVIEEETKKLKKNIADLLNKWADKLED